MSVEKLISAYDPASAVLEADVLLGTFSSTTLKITQDILRSSSSGEHYTIDVDKDATAVGEFRVKVNGAQEFVINNNGYMGLNTTTPTYLQTINTTVADDGISLEYSGTEVARLSNDGGATKGRLTLLDASVIIVNLEASGVSWFDGGFVAIGKKTASVELDVDGTINATAMVVTGDITSGTFTGNGAGLTGITGATGGISNTVNTNIVADSDGNGSGVVTLTINTTDALTVLNNGNIGIGTSTPSSILHVETATNKGFRVKELTDVSSIFSDYSSGGSVLELSRNTDGVFDSWIGKYESATTSVLAVYGREELALGASTAEVLRIDLPGNVGIGTITPGNDTKVDTPSRILTVASPSSGGATALELLKPMTSDNWLGSIKFINSDNSDNTSATAKNVATIVAYSKVTAANAADDGGCELRFLTKPVGGTTTTAMIIDDSQNVGMGVDTPISKLHVDQSSATGAVPVLTLDQADVSEEMIQFETTIGTGNAIEAIAAKTLTTTHFIKITIPGGLTRYIPCGTIA